MLSDSDRDYLKTVPLINHALKKTGLDFEDLLKIRVRRSDSIFPEKWPIIFPSSAFGDKISKNDKERAGFFRAVRPAVLSIFAFSMPPSTLRTVLYDGLKFYESEAEKEAKEEILAPIQAGRKKGGEATAEARKTEKEERKAEAKKQWKELEKKGVPEHERAGKIKIKDKKNEQMSVHTVRRLLREAGVRKGD